MFNIARNTFREILRNRIFSIIIVFAFLFLLFTTFLSQLTIGDVSRIFIDFGLAMIELFGIVSVIFVGSQLLFNEIHGKTIFLILSKPIQKYEFILGKFLGFSAIIFLIVALQSFIFFGILLFHKVEITSLVLWSLVNTFFKLEILLALLFFFSTFVSNIITIISTILLYMIGHSASNILDVAYKTKNEVFIFLSKGINTILPPFEALNTKDIIGTFSYVPALHILINIAYAGLYIVFLLIISVFIFSKKRFEA